ncbi:winged helix-turn-helix transcriptional regulator [Listeria grandensis]|uniref:Winged helix-turn-helix transcriptional regulator n=1 Tax=Listeria grandensis TaxID=1494963 RepID=A0A7X0Y4R1_9LIST|nr:winged helix-turn-helix transcriptional regulator [Listeria grandensis]MBC1475377.1 winged helix-turn-helix transcriptional regulator [Listeria grandensis]MBC1936753.1 winged helix-turn-helix transcriptional regulator [Listeria grandensis]
MQKRKTSFSCGADVTSSVIGGKWKLQILFQLMDKTIRFNEFRRLMPEITQRMLTLQLRELEEDGVVHREMYHQIPPKVEYSLTDLGESLVPIVRAMCDWGFANEEAIITNRTILTQTKEPSQP